jgi:arginyl-tRNA synthetase
MDLENLLRVHVAKALESLYAQVVDDQLIQLQQTRREFVGDITLVVFPFVKLARKSPEQAAAEIGNYLKENVQEVADFNVVKGFLNIEISESYWIHFLDKALADNSFGIKQPNTEGAAVMIEYSSPNTNKPLHLGHVRNNLLGYSISRIMQANGHRIVKANLVNDRGIHICKSMIAWQKFGNGETPASSGKKGDHLVGDYYVRFDQEYKKEIAALVAQGSTEDDAKKNAPIIVEAQDMLRKWEAGDKAVVSLWKTMNGWVYEGFDVTYKKLGVDFDKVYYESETYLLGKALVMKGLEGGVLYKREDGSIWADLTADGLDEKLLLRSDGTSVYMTQDIGTANQRFVEYNLSELIYVVGNEQNYHFQVLKLVLAKLGFSWAQSLTHLSYGMVELPEGKMKSREGTVVDADDLVDEMVTTARDMSNELGKLEGYSTEEANNIYRIIGLGALKYFILKVDPKKNMTFDPKESIDFNGNTGPFIQYTYARIRSVLRKAEDDTMLIPALVPSVGLSVKERNLLKSLYLFPETIAEAGKNYSPAVIANYVYELAKDFNQFYHDHSILKEENVDVRNFRLMLSKKVSQVLESSLALMGIEVPERM